jgi:hypothetical protein
MLVELYPKESDARRVVADADIEARRIGFEGSADGFWFSILEEARKQRRVHALVAVASREYPPYAEPLAAAVADDAAELLEGARASVQRGDVAGAFARAAEAGALAPAGKDDRSAATLADTLRRLDAWERRAGDLTVDDAKRAVDLAEAVHVEGGAIGPPRLDAIHAGADRAAGAPSLDRVLRLDRAEQRKGFDDLIEDRPRVVAFLVHGELDQGHGHLVDLAACRLRQRVEPRCRKVTLRWPDEAAPGIRLNALAEALAEALGMRSQRVRDLVKADAGAPDGGAAWDQRAEPLCDELAAAASRGGWLLCHPVSRPTAADAGLVDAYLRRIWARVAARSTGGYVALAFAVARAVGGGFPLLRAWRTSRRERRAARQIERVFQGGLGFENGGVAALPELDSVHEEHIAEWLRRVRGMAPERAIAQAREVFADSNRGRFEMVVKLLEASTLTR